MERLRQERLLAEAAQAAGPAAPSDTEAVHMETASVTSEPPAEKAKKGLLGRVTSKLRKQVPRSSSSSKQEQGSGAAGTTMSALTVAAAAAADSTVAKPGQLPLHQQQQQQQDGRMARATPLAVAATAAGAAAGAGTGSQSPGSHSEDADDATILLTATGDESELTAAAGGGTVRKPPGEDRQVHVWGSSKTSRALRSACLATGCQAAGPHSHPALPFMT
jgi:hypothetical protein